MFTESDYQNLRALLSRATYNGLQEATLAVVLDSKLQTAIQALKDVKDGDDSKGNS